MLKLLQRPQAQSTGQGWTLQTRVSVALPEHLAPPLVSTVATRLRDCTPPPHFSVQEPKCDQVDQAQSVGHGGPQDNVWLKLPVHAAPPLACTCL